MLTHPIVGLLIFAVVMFGIFEALFAGAEPLISAIESVTGFMQAQAAAILPPGVFQDLVVDGIIAGVGNVIVFAPQILMLFLFIGFLEDSGYLARVAFVIDRVMKGVGLTEKHSSRCCLASPAPFPPSWPRAPSNAVETVW